VTLIFEFKVKCLLFSLYLVHIYIRKAECRVPISGHFDSLILTFESKVKFLHFLFNKLVQSITCISKGLPI